MVPGALTSLTVEPGTATVAAGSSQRFAVTAVDVAGNQVGVEPAWRVSAGEGRIDADGTFSGTAAGAVTVAAAVADLSVEAAVEVTPGPLASIEVTPRRPDITAGAAQVFEATGPDALGNDGPSRRCGR